jgi:hypothetical protein
VVIPSNVRELEIDVKLKSEDGNIENITQRET